MPWKDLNGRPVTTSQCDKGAEQKRQRLSEEDMWDITERDIQADGRPLAKVTSFKYLGRVLTEVDENWPAVVENLWKARKSWPRMERILGLEGTSPQVFWVFFKVVVQAVLLFRLETWVMNPLIVSDLGSFQHTFDRRITGIQPKK